MASENAHTPYVPDDSRMPEFTWSAVLVGAALGIVFGASSLYLVLKVGMTVSASIPVAVLSITLFRVFSKLPFVRRATILENNIVQTTGSAGESIAFGVGVTMPALMLLGFEMDIGRVMVVSVLGGLLGILMMIPLRRAFIVKQHGTLKYPEGTACADVLIVGEKGGATAKTVFVGFGIAFAYQFLWQGMKLWKETASKSLSWFKGAVPAIEVNPALLGVGYIIGTRISCVMVGGGILASFVLIPAIRLFGDGLQQPIFPATKLIKDMDEEGIWHEYILYIGAGAVAAGGIISLFQALPLILGSLKAGLSDIGLFRRTDEKATGPVPRTDRDLPLWIVGVGGLVLVAAIWATRPLHEVLPWVPDLHMNPLGALLIVLFGFLFVTVSSRITGEIGSSSNPISGMTVATLLLTCLIFLLLGWDHPEDRLTALSVAAVVCIAASNGGTTSQDLKTGYLVGGTPKYQQMAILVGALSSSVFIGWILIGLNDAYTVYSRKDLPVLKKPVDVANLPQAKAPDDDTNYFVWHAPQENEQGVPPAKYLVSATGKEIKYLVDPGINGKRSRDDNGVEVTRFKAPKAQLMSLITDGILQQKLPWSLVLLGVAIAVVLELCGVPSLAFAVGVYLPLSSSTPIFAGGLVRYVADKWGASSAGASGSQTDSDSSPGVLLATGYIAGGAIAGVVIGFLSFSDTIPRYLARWEYRTYNPIRSGSMPFKTMAENAAKAELGLTGNSSLSDEEREQLTNLAKEIYELNDNMLPQYILVPQGMTLKLPGNKSFTATKQVYLKEIAETEMGKAEKAAMLFEDNKSELLQTVKVPAGTTLKLPDDKTYKAEAATTLGDVANAALGDRQKAEELFAANKDQLANPDVLPENVALRLPQHTAVAVIAFLVLIVVLTLVGLGWILKSPPPTQAMPEHTS